MNRCSEIISLLSLQIYLIQLNQISFSNTRKQFSLRLIYYSFFFVNSSVLNSIKLLSKVAYEAIRSKMSTNSRQTLTTRVLNNFLYLCILIHEIGIFFLNYLLNDIGFPISISGSIICIWLSIIWNNSWGWGILPVSNFDHTGTSVILVLLKINLKIYELYELID